jgi:hypothetical protein
MNKKEKSPDNREVPEWLVSLVIRLRVARWRLVERLNRWAAGKRPGQLQLYFILFMIAGGLTYCFILDRVLEPRQEARMREQDSIVWHYRWTFERRERWKNLSDDPRLQRDENFYWHLVDSLMADSNLRHSIDSVLKARPGLADTLQRVEQMHPRKIKQ